MPDFAVNPVSLGGGGLSAPDGVSTPPPAATAGLVNAADGQAGTGASPSYALPPPPFDSVVRFQRAMADAGLDADEPRPADARGVAAAPLDKIRTLCGEGMPHVEAPCVDVASRPSAPQVDAPLPAAPQVATPLSAAPSVDALAPATPQMSVPLPAMPSVNTPQAVMPHVDTPSPVVPSVFDSGVQSPCVLAPAVAPTGEIPSTQSGSLSRGAAATPRASAGFDAPPPVAPQVATPLPIAPSVDALASATPQLVVPLPAMPSVNTPQAVMPYVAVPSPAAPPPFDTGVQSPRVLAAVAPTGEIPSTQSDALSRGAAATPRASVGFDAPVPAMPPLNTPQPLMPHVDAPSPAAPPAFDSGVRFPRVLAAAVPTGEISSAPGDALSRGVAATPRASAGFDAIKSGSPHVDAPVPAAPQSEEPAAPHNVPFALGQPPSEVLSASTPSSTLAGAAAPAEAAAASARTETLAVTVSNIVEAVTTQVLVTPALAQGEGTVRMVLKPDVLDGAVVTLTAQEGTLTVALTTATPNAASLAAAALPQLEVALASHAPAFHHVAVVLTSARKGLSNETT